MHTSILSVLAAASVASLFCIGPAIAEPEAAAEPETPAEVEAPAEDEDPDESFAKSLLGRSYSGDLDLEGWTSFGGGLVSPPIYVHLYQREDGTSLVLTSKLSSRKYVVTDALMISKPWKGYEISIACTQGDDFTLRFIGDARGPDEKEWWTEVRRAWEIDLPPKPESDAESESEGETETAAEPAETKPEPQPGKTSEASTKGIRCTNPNW